MPYVPVGLGPAGEAVRANLRTLRKARGLSQAQLAEKIDAKTPGRVRRAKLQSIEAGYHRVDVDDLAAIAQGLDVAPEKLLAPWECETCGGKPAPRFACRDCGTEGT